MDLVKNILGSYFTPITTTANIFVFKDFLTAVTLLVIVYTISDIRYHFRLSVAPMRSIGLFRLTYYLIIFIGLGTLANEIWVYQKWLVPKNCLSSALWQGMLGFLFISLVITWMRYAFIKPPIFGKNNYKKYSEALYQIILRGSAEELPIIAHELALSAESIVSFANDLKSLKGEAEEEAKPSVEVYANDILLLIANKRFCRHVVASSPVTVIRFIDAVVESEAYHRVPIGLFLENISTAAIENKDSSLYHEDAGYYSGLLGYIKPLSTALYGNYELVEALEHHSPLDIHYKSVWAWDSEQFQVYCNAVLITFNNYIQTRKGTYLSSPLINRSLNTVSEFICRAINETNEESNKIIFYGTSFIKECINKLNPPPQVANLRIRCNNHWIDFYDFIAQVMFDIITESSYIKGSKETIWSIQYNAVWSKFFTLNNNRAWKIVLFKLRRLIYNEISTLESFPNYKSASVLGVCLNIMGLEMMNRHSYQSLAYRKGYSALKSVVLAWTKRNYLSLRKQHLDIANTCLIGSITFDEKQSKLIKTYTGINENKEYLSLDE
jgi:hypothetical protein